MANNTHDYSDLRKNFKNKFKNIIKESATSGMKEGLYDALSEKIKLSHPDINIDLEDTKEAIKDAVVNSMMGIDFEIKAANIDVSDFIFLDDEGLSKKIDELYQKLGDETVVNQKALARKIMAAFSEAENRGLDINKILNLGFSNEEIRKDINSVAAFTQEQLKGLSNKVKQIATNETLKLQSYINSIVLSGEDFKKILNHKGTKNVIDFYKEIDKLSESDLSIVEKNLKIDSTDIIGKISNGLVKPKDAIDSLLGLDINAKSFAEFAESGKKIINLYDTGKTKTKEYKQELIKLLAVQKEIWSNHGFSKNLPADMFSLDDIDKNEDLYDSRDIDQTKIFEAIVKSKKISEDDLYRLQDILSDLKDENEKKFKALSTGTDNYDKIYDKNKYEKVIVDLKEITTFIEDSVRGTKEWAEGIENLIALFDESKKDFKGVGAFDSFNPENFKYLYDAYKEFDNFSKTLGVDVNDISTVIDKIKTMDLESVKALRDKFKSAETIGFITNDYFSQLDKIIEGIIKEADATENLSKIQEKLNETKANEEKIDNKSSNIVSETKEETSVIEQKVEVQEELNEAKKEEQKIEDKSSEKISETKDETSAIEQKTEAQEEYNESLKEESKIKEASSVADDSLTNKLKQAYIDNKNKNEVAKKEDTTPLISEPETKEELNTIEQKLKKIEKLQEQKRELIEKRNSLEESLIIGTNDFSKEDLKDILDQYGLSYSKAIDEANYQTPQALMKNILEKSNSKKRMSPLDSAKKNIAILAKLDAYKERMGDSFDGFGDINYEDYSDFRKLIEEFDNTSRNSIVQTMNNLLNERDRIEEEIKEIINSDPLLKVQNDLKNFIGNISSGKYKFGAKNKAQLKNLYLAYLKQGGLSDYRDFTNDENILKFLDKEQDLQEIMKAKNNRDAERSERNKSFINQMKLNHINPDGTSLMESTATATATAVEEEGKAAEKTSEQIGELNEAKRINALYNETMAKTADVTSVALNEEGEAAEKVAESVAEVAENNASIVAENNVTTTPIQSENKVDKEAMQKGAIEALKKKQQAKKEAEAKKEKFNNVKAYAEQRLLKEENISQKEYEKQIAELFERYQKNELTTKEYYDAKQKLYNRTKKFLREEKEQEEEISELVAINREFGSQMLRYGKKSGYSSDYSESSLNKSLIEAANESKGLDYSGQINEDFEDNFMVNSKIIAETTGDIIKEELSKEKFKELSEYGKEGYVEGFDGAGKSVAEDTIQEFKEATKTHSPSKVFEELGYWCGEGFKIGYDKSGKTIKKSVDEFISSIKDEMIRQNVSPAEMDDFVKKNPSKFNKNSNIYKAVTSLWGNHNPAIYGNFVNVPNSKDSKKFSSNITMTSEEYQRILDLTKDWNKELGDALNIQKKINKEGEIYYKIQGKNGTAMANSKGARLDAAYSDDDFNKYDAQKKEEKAEQERIKKAVKQANKDAAEYDELEYARIADYYEGVAEEIDEVSSLRKELMNHYKALDEDSSYAYNQDEISQKEMRYFALGGNLQDLYDRRKEIDDVDELKKKRIEAEIDFRNKQEHEAENYHNKEKSRIDEENKQKEAIAFAKQASREADELERQQIKDNNIAIDNYNNNAKKQEYDTEQERLKWIKEAEEEAIKYRQEEAKIIQEQIEYEKEQIRLAKEYQDESYWLLNYGDRENDFGLIKSQENKAKKTEKVIDYTNQLNNLEKEYNDWINSLLTDDKSKIKLSKLIDFDEIRDDLSNVVDTSELISKFKKLIPEIQKEFNKLKTNNKDLLKVDPLTIKKQITKISSYLSANTAMPIGYKNILSGFRTELESALDPNGNNLNLSIARFKELALKILDTENEVENLGKAGKSGMTKFNEQLSHLNEKWMSQFLSFYDIIRYIRTMYTEVKNIDSALIELKKVTSDLSVERLNKSLKQSFETARELGSEVTTVINATADWARLGYGIADAEAMARITTLYKNIGDNMDMDKASEYLISTLKGFQLDVEDGMSIIDKFNEVANNYAIDTAGIGEALERSAASFNTANTSLSESIALITATNAVVQNPDTVGTMWKTVAARIRGAKTELEDMGEDTEGMVESTSKLRDLIKGMTGFDIMKDEKTFKSIYDIVVGIGEKWKDLNDIDRAALLEALAGKRAGNSLAAALNNVDELKKVYKTAEESAGSALREQENYQKSIQYSTDLFKAELSQLYSNLMNSDWIKRMIDGFTEVLKIVTKLTDKVPSILAIGGMFGVSGFLGSNKAAGFANNIQKGLGNFIKNFGNESVIGSLLNPNKFISGFKNVFVNSAIASLSENENEMALKDAISKFVSQDVIDSQDELRKLFEINTEGSVKLATSFLGLSKEQKNLMFETIAYSKELVVEKINKDNLNAADIVQLYNKRLLTKATIEQAIAENTLNDEKAEELKLAKKMILNQKTASIEIMAAIAIAAVLTAAVYGISKAIDSNITSMEDLEKSIENDTKKLEEYKNEISELQSEYNELENSINELKETNEDNINDLRIKNLTEEMDTVKKLTEAYEELEAQKTKNVLDAKQKEWNEGLLYNNTYRTFQDIGQWKFGQAILDHSGNSLIRGDWGDYEFARYALNFVGTSLFTPVAELNNLFNPVEEDNKTEQLQKEIDNYKNTVAELEEVNKKLTLSPDDKKLKKEKDNLKSALMDSKETLLSYKVELTELDRDRENELRSHYERMAKLQEGGNVDLFNRPKVDAGYDPETGKRNYKTVDSYTFGNKDGTVYMNFTPIIVDEDGNYKDTLSYEALRDYAENVINGVQSDDLNLKIGGTFDNLALAENAAVEIHELQEQYYEELSNMPAYFEKELITEIDNVLSDNFEKQEVSFVEGVFKKALVEMSNNLSDKDFIYKDIILKFYEDLYNGNILDGIKNALISISEINGTDTNLADMFETLNEEVEMLKENLEPLWETLTKETIPALLSVFDLIGEILKKISTNMKNADYDRITTIVAIALEIITEDLEKTIFWLNVSLGLLNLITDALVNFEDNIDNIKTKISDLLKDLSDKITQNINGIIRKILLLINNGLTNIQKNIDDILKNSKLTAPIANAIDDIISRCRKFFNSELPTIIMDAVPYIVDLFSLIGELINSLDVNPFDNGGIFDVIDSYYKRKQFEKNKKDAISNNRASVYADEHYTSYTSPQLQSSPLSDIDKLNMALNSDDNKALKSSLVGLSKEGKLDKDTLSSYREFNYLLKSLGITVSEDSEDMDKFVELINGIADRESLNSIKAFGDDLNNLKSAYENFASGKRITIEQLEALENSYGNLDSYRAFEEAVMSGEKKLQPYFDNLATEMMTREFALDGITEATKQYYIEELKSIGITNAQEVAENALAKKEQERIDTMEQITAYNDYYNKSQSESITSTEQLENASYEQLATMEEEAEKAGLSSDALAKYALKKALVSGVILDEKTDINEIARLAGVAGVGCEALDRLLEAKQRFDNVVAGREGASTAAARGVKTMLEAEMNQIRKDLALEINDELNKDYYSGSTVKWKPDIDTSGSAKEAKETLDKLLKVFQAELDAGKITFQEYVNKSLQAIEEYYKKGKITAQEYYDYLSDLYNNQIGIYDKVISAVQKVYSDEIDKLNKQKEEVQKSYNEQIEVIQKKIDSIQEENNEIDRNMALSKAQYQLARSQNQRTKLMYSESRGFYYEADLSSIKDAQEEVRKAQLDKEIYEYEKQIKSLQDTMEKEVDVIDKEIDRLQKLSDAWGEVSSKLENEINRQYAAQILGANWEKEILEGREKLLEDFTNTYVGLQQKQKEAYLDARRAELDGGSGSGSNGNSSNGDYKGTGSYKTVYSYNGKDYETEHDASNAKKVDLLLLQQKYKPMLDNVSAEHKSNLEAEYNKKVEEIKNRKITSKKIAAKFAGTSHATPGETLVGELGSEIILNKNGTATIVDEPTIVDMKGGEKVFNAKETERILKASKKGFSSLKDINPKKFAMLNSFASGTSSAMQNAIATQAVGIASGVRNGLMSMPLATANGQTINNTFNVSLPNINDASKASDLMREFEHLFTKSTQYFN